MREIRAFRYFWPNLMTPAALGARDLSVLHIAGEWVAEGAAPSADGAKLEAEAVALRLG